MINVLHITMSFGPGGRREAIKNLLLYTSRDGFQTFLCCLDGFQCSAEFMAGLDRSKCFDIESSKLSGVSTVLAVMRLIRKHHIDVIHVHDGASHFYGAVAALLTGRCRIVLTYHRSDDIDTSTFKDVVRNRLLHFITDGTVTASLARKRYYATRNHISPDDIQTIYYGLDTDYWDVSGTDLAAKQREMLGLGKDTKVIGVAANLIERKSVLNVIMAFAALSGDADDIVLVVAGDGPQRAMLEAECSSRGVETRVLFVGQQSDMRPWYALFDVFVLTSLEEAFGLVYAEALLGGTPVIGSNVGGVPEIIEDGCTGLLVPSNAPRFLSIAIKRILSSPEESARMARNGQIKCRQMFSLARMVEEYSSLYARVNEAHSK